MVLTFIPKNLDTRFCPPWQQQPLENGNFYGQIISRFLTEWIHNINKSLFKPRKHLNISATLYLVDFALWNANQQVLLNMIN